MTRRVVVTAMSGITAFGTEWNEIQNKLAAKKNAVRYMSEWDYSDDLRTRLAAPVECYEIPKYPRKKIRSMGRVSLLATGATEQALESAGLLQHPALTDGSTGIAYGSSSGSIPPITKIANLLETGSMKGYTSTTYVELMRSTVTVNLKLRRYFLEVWHQ